MAETAESSKEGSIDNAVAMSERDFEPAGGQDIDDEATIDEEETLEAGEGFNDDELDDLQKDAEVPIEDLLAFYYNPVNDRGDGHVPLDDIQPEPLPPYDDHTEDMQQNGVDISPTQSPIPQDSPRSASPSQSSSVNPPENQRITRGLAAAYQYFPDSDSSSSDEDYAPAEDWKKEIHIGPEHQAEVPETTCPDTDEDEKHDSKCLWSPKGIAEQKLQKYVDTVCGSGWDGGTSCVMSKGDDEQALYVLLQCNYNCEEAINKFKSQPPPSQEMTFWSEEECRNFELGLRQFGKDFYSIQRSKIPGRTVGDIVQFYYLWKKTERHDAFSWQIRSKKKYSFHPGIT
ncbi:mesoderm induction early response 1-like [Paramuricea clavata]|uniref:Mesoderm induction early response 1-like n=2 Tax=Paramuricea clavata TaxID=317549 RepID=A0A6S7H7G2_PARCT|nr:mesoderm induction early response 1-like [Paramuricea clavata]